MEQSKYEVIIGLEVHVQLKTATKLFCGCDNNSDGIPANTNICPVCLGHPGTLPRLNRTAVEWSVRAALALGCKVHEQSKFDRKNYFYPDLPKGYQISQYDEPIGREGSLVISVGDHRKEVGIERLHLEEDAGKLTHHKGHSTVDFNRAGTPLMEIVSKPHMHSPLEAKTYLQEIRLIMRYLGVSDADMEKGHLRADGNISLRPIGEEILYPKVEIKNVNSFRNIERALEFEIARQTELWDRGEIPVQETRGFNPDTGQTATQRLKEKEADYRYFPEPDIPPLMFAPDFLEQQQGAIPELPDRKRLRFVQEFGVNLPDAVVLTSSKDVAEFFEMTRSEALAWLSSKRGANGVTPEEEARLTKLCVSWITTELFRAMRASGKQLRQLKITPENMAEFIAMIYQREINSSAAQVVLEEMVKAEDHEPDPSAIVQEKNLLQVSDAGEIETMVDQVMLQNSQIVEQIKAGKENGIQFLVGQVMKISKGKADPAKVQELIRQKVQK